MGCPISKASYYNGKGCKNYFEYTPDDCDGKKILKKKIQERTLSTRQSKVIRDENITSKYNIKSLIGVGTFSDVFFVTDKVTSLPYAIKVIELSCLKTQRVFQSESQALQKLTASKVHPNIVKLKEIISCNFSAYIIMELATGGDLFDRIQLNRHIEEREAMRITKMILDAVFYLHRHGITHRDLKPENVLFYTPSPDSKIIVTDFGFASCRDPNSFLDTYCGTLEYLSPEIILGTAYSNKADIWAIGVIVYYMLSGSFPFHGRDALSFYEEISNRKQSYEQKVWQTISSKAKQFITCALAKKEENRFNATEALHHPWLSKARGKHAKQTNRGSSGRSSESSRSHEKKEPIAEFDELPYLEDVDQSKAAEKQVNNTVRRMSADVEMTSTNNVLKQYRKNSTGISNKAYEDCMNTTTVTEKRRVYSDSHVDTENIFVLPSYSKRISKEDLFADTNSSSSTCDRKSSFFDDANDKSRPTHTNRISQIEQGEVTSNTHNHVVTNSQVVQLPPLPRRSQSSTPILNVSSLPHKKSSLGTPMEYREQQVDREKLDTLFSVQTSSVFPTAPHRINAWSNSQNNVYPSRIEEWLTHNNKDKASRDEVHTIPYGKRYKSSKRDCQKWWKLNKEIPSEALSKSI